MNIFNLLIEANQCNEMVGEEPLIIRLKQETFDEVLELVESDMNSMGINRTYFNEDGLCPNCITYRGLGFRVWNK